MLERFKDVEVEKGENFYDVIGTNLKNLIDDQKSFINKKFRFSVSSSDLNYIQHKSISLTEQDIQKILKKDILKRLRRLNNKKFNNINKIKREFDSYFYFMHYLLISLQIDLQKVFKENISILQIKPGSESYRVFNFGDIQNIQKNIDILWKKVLIESNIFNATKNSAAVKTVNKLYLQEQYDRWSTFFEQSSWKKYQIKILPKIKVDQQQQEKEGIIQKIITAIVPKQILKAVPIIATPVAAAVITSEYVQRFNQKSGVDKGANHMQDWFLEMFKKGEEIYGKQFYITSGYRTDAYQQELRNNPRIKAARNSPHVQGVAADISLVGVNPTKVIAAFKQAGFNRFGVGKSFIHIDAGDKLNSNIWRPYARWSYKY